MEVEAVKLEFLYTPVRDITAALELYRDKLGWQEVWREGDLTVSLQMPGTEVQLMLDQAGPDAGEDDGVGPLFVVDSVVKFHENRPDTLGVRVEPQEIPGGYLATYEDTSGNPIRVMDQSQESS
jgi:catechol 2,3-dioxygenase-like lactoylglutathione lyase family enzyme